MPHFPESLVTIRQETPPPVRSFSTSPAVLEKQSFSVFGEPRRSHCQIPCFFVWSIPSRLSAPDHIQGGIRPHALDPPKAHPGQ